MTRKNNLFYQMHEGSTTRIHASVL